MKNEISINGKNWTVAKVTKRKMILHAIINDGPRLVAWRKKNKLDQRAAAERLGLSQPMIAHIEANHRALPEHVMLK